MGAEPEEAGDEAEERGAPPEPDAPAHAPDHALERARAGAGAKAVDAAGADRGDDPVRAAGKDLGWEGPGEVVRCDALKGSNLVLARCRGKGGCQADNHVQKEEAVAAGVGVAKGRACAGHSQRQSVWESPHFV